MTRCLLPRSLGLVLSTCSAPPPPSPPASAPADSLLCRVLLSLCSKFKLTWIVGSLKRSLPRCSPHTAPHCTPCQQHLLSCGPGRVNCLHLHMLHIKLAAPYSICNVQRATRHPLLHHHCHRHPQPSHNNVYNNFININKCSVSATSSRFLCVSCAIFVDSPASYLCVEPFSCQSPHLFFCSVWSFIGLK